jgi:elongation factor Ts
MDPNIIKLRELTNAGVMECKRALEEANGDFERAVQIIKEKGLLKAETKKERKAGAGGIFSYIHNKRIGVLLLLRAETDFVVKSEPFQELANEVLMQIAAVNPESVEVLLDSPYIKDESKKFSEVIKEAIAKVGENIEVEKFARFEV